MKKTILIVDDDSSILKTLFRYIQDDLYDIKTAMNSSDAFNILKTETVHVIISDNQMPDMEGLELLKMVKYYYPDVVRIIFSGNFDLYALIDAINDDVVYRIIIKPWSGQDIKKIIKDSLDYYEIIQMWNISKA